MLDFHNHLMPAVDDGASDIDESRIGLQTLKDHGVREIITTPHLRGSLTDRPKELAAFLAVLDEAWLSLQGLATAEFPEIRLERGVELMLDIPRPHLEDPRLRLAGSSFALVEFPFMSVPPHSTLAVRNIVESGYTPIVAHPERYSNMPSSSDLVEAWRDAGAYIQVNSGSLLGFYGSVARRFAWMLLEQGYADYLSSDYHSRGKCAVAECAKVLKSRDGVAQHRTLTHTNPHRLLSSQPPLGVPPLESGEPPLWKRVLPW
ncbi:MAG: hypothetical protein H0U59_12365 [Gemmatimonadaceae bacterium]|nr:hypothetical protein [Gemmatimonadaceae bacterium]